MPSAIRQTLVTTAVASACALVVALVVVAAARPVILQTPLSNVAANTNYFNPGVITSGDATVSTRPDIAFINVGVGAQASSASGAQRDLATVANKLIAKAKSLGVPDKEISTSGYSIGPIYSPDGRAVITGYQAGLSLNLKWHNVDNVGTALDGLVQQGGATRISVSFGLNDPKVAQAEARALAIADARSRASAMAKAAGVQLGQVLRISDQTQVSRPTYSYAPSAAAVDQTQVPVGQLDVTVSVEVDFALA